MPESVPQAHTLYGDLIASTWPQENNMHKKRQTMEHTNRTPADDWIHGGA